MASHGSEAWKDVLSADQRLALLLLPLLPLPLLRTPSGRGRTSATAVAEPVVVGARLSMPERQRRRSFFFALGMSTMGCVPVRLCTVVIIPLSMPSFSWMTWMGLGLGLGLGIGFRPGKMGTP